MAKWTTADIEEGKQYLRDMLSSGDKIYTITRTVSRSGMSRRLTVVIPRDGDIIDITWAVARALDRNVNDDGVQCEGTGMDMGFDLVYNLSHELFGDGYALEQKWIH